MNSCPALDRLERLLDNGLVDTELDAIERHVEVCADYQRRLDELTSATPGAAATTGSLGGGRSAWCDRRRDCNRV
jgi:hypothetical protein